MTLNTGTPLRWSEIHGIIFRVVSGEMLAVKDGANLAVLAWFPSLTGRSRLSCRSPFDSDRTANPADLVGRILQNAAKSIRLVGEPEDCGFPIDSAGELEFAFGW